MRLETLFKEKKCPFAIEVFPPKKQSAVQTVYNMLDDLGKIPCDYISVTYSAGGDGAKEYTAQISQRLKKEQGIEPLAHLTCMNARKQDIARELNALTKAGVENILALRGDAPHGNAHVHDYAHAGDLIKEIALHGGFYLVAACYPEGHPESPSLIADILNLKTKIEAGAGHLVTQLFFDNDKFWSFLELARTQGINCPIEAGVMPITRPQQIARTVALSSATLPANFAKTVAYWQQNEEAYYKAGIEYAIMQIRALIQGGVDGIHLYAMNNADVAKRVYEGIKDLL